MWDLIVSVPDRCLTIYFDNVALQSIKVYLIVLEAKLD